MKKSYVLFITLALVLVFSVLANSILETNSIKNENFVQKTLYLQAKNHILFLEDYILNSDLEDTKDIKIVDVVFEIVAKRDKEDSKLFFLSVYNKKFAIRLTKQVVIE